MGSDLSVVNDARVSFAKASKKFEEKDKGLIRYLATHQHWTPFAGCSVKLRINAPIFVARQLFKHKVGFNENEVSRRYVDDEPEFFVPETWRKRAENKKQGSSEETIEVFGNVYVWEYNETYPVDKISDEVEYLFEHSLYAYEKMLESGVCPEQARMVLPQSMMTEWIWTGSLAAWARVVGLRLDPHAQKETRDVVQKISEIIAPLFPESWAALTADAGTDYRGEVHRLRKLLQENGIKY